LHISLLPHPKDLKMMHQGIHINLIPLLWVYFPPPYSLRGNQFEVPLFFFILNFVFYVFSNNAIYCNLCLKLKSSHGWGPYANKLHIFETETIWETWLRRLVWVASLDGIVLEFRDSINSVLLMHNLLAAFGGKNVGLDTWES